MRAVAVSECRAGPVLAWSGIGGPGPADCGEPGSPRCADRRLQCRRAWVSARRGRRRPRRPRRSARPCRRRPALAGGHPVARGRSSGLRCHGGGWLSRPAASASAQAALSALASSSGPASSAASSRACRSASSRACRSASSRACRSASSRACRSASSRACRSASSRAGLVRSNRRPSGAREYRTGVPHSVRLPSSRIAPAGLGQGSFQRVAVGDRPVKLAREDDRRVVGDLELHRHHRGQALLDQALRHPGERVAGIAAGTLAGVQHRQAGLVVFGEQAAELLAGHLLGPPGAVLHDQHAGAPVGPVAAVADEMENVEFVPAQPLPQRRSCWRPAAR